MSRFTVRRNPFVDGFICTTFKVIGKERHENVMKIVVLAETREKAALKVQKAFGSDSEYKFTLDHVNVIS